MILRVSLGLLGLLGFQLYSYRNLPDQAVAVWQHGHAYVDDVTFYLKRFDAVRPQLPPRGHVGYRTDHVIKEAGEEYFEYRRADGLVARDNAKKCYFLAQYALAPLIVDKTRTYPLVVENTREGVRLVRRESE